MTHPDLSTRHARLTPAQQARLAARLQGGAPASRPGVGTIVRRHAAEAPLSHAQERHWFLWQLDPTDPAYHLSAALRLEGRLDRAALQAALDAVVARHEALRTRIEPDAQGVPRQHVQPAAPLALALSDVSHLPEARREAEAQALADALGAQPFDLRRGPLLRARLVVLGEDSHLLCLAMHHIAGDAWSKALILGEFAQHYAARVRQGCDAVLPPLPIQYADHAWWQRETLVRSGVMAQQLAYWRAQLGGEQPVLQLPTDHPRSAAAARRAASHAVVLPRALAAALQAQAGRQGASLFMALLTAFQVVLRRHGGLDDIRVGVPIANRHHAETEGVVGCFVNTQVLRAQLTDRTTLAEALAQTRDAALGAQAHQDLPFECLVEALQPGRDPRHTPLFQVMFNHLREAADAPLAALPGLRLRSYTAARAAPPFELVLDTTEQADGTLQAVFHYRAALFEAGRIERLAAHFAGVLDDLAHRPGLRLREVARPLAQEQAELDAWCDGGAPLALSAASPTPFIPIHHQIERRAREAPRAVALVLGEVQLSRSDLDERASRLAHRLQSLGVGPDVLVGVLMLRSVEMVVALLAILKAGGAYVPLDPEHPAERLALVAADSGLALLLTHAPALPSAAALPADLRRLVLDEDGRCAGPQPTAGTAPTAALHAENLAYVIHTSGSTGRPKGAANRHLALANRLAWMQAACGLDDTEAVLQKTPFGFDVSVWEFFWPLCRGARLVLAPPGAHRDPAHLVDLVCRHGVTTLHFVPSMLQAFLAHPGASACTGLRRVVCSGEALGAELQRALFERLPGVALHNLYGPTEAAIDVTHWRCDPGADSARPVPIGRPIAGLATRILDASLNAVPPGVAGELYLGGVGLGRGYVGRPGLTAERFIADPFDPAGGRLYRTGDLARWRGDGQIEYLGRVDHQIKLRGVRIEPGEIEARLRAQPGVGEAVVAAWDDPARGALLAAYVTPRTPAEPPDAALLRERLAQVLPQAMVPAVVQVLDALPLNANGKLDRRALPRPAPGTAPGGTPWAAPQGELESLIAQVWAEVLAQPRVGRRDDFFALGGHSLLAAQVVHRLRQAARRELSVADLFQAATPQALAALWRQRPPIADTTGALDDLGAYLDMLETP